MRLYGGIDLHSNNSVVVIQDEADRRLFEKRLRNDLPTILRALAPFASELEGIVVESTYNWYWLVYGLMAADYRVHLAHTTAIQTYAGLKHGDDITDASWLAHLLRLGLLAEGYIYPKAERGLRDLLRKRGQLVRQRTTQLLSIQNQVLRSTAQRLSGNRIKQLTADEVEALLPEADVALAVTSNLAVMDCLVEQIHQLERVIRQRVRPRPELDHLCTVDGIGPILAWTILLEVGDIGRFGRVGQFVSYCRCVEANRLTNGKKKGENNGKNGNRYLAWAFVEAAHFAVRYNPKIQRYYQRKQAKKNGAVATKAVAHKLARACYYILRENVPFDVDRAFA
jgi:transposase